MTAVWRWRTTGVPTWSGRPVTAFMPLPSWTAEIWQSFKGWLNGQPGTEAIPAPNNDIPRYKYAVGDGQAYARDFGGSWYPQIWYQENFSTYFTNRDGNTGASTFAGGVCVYSDNQLPVPAIEPQRGTRRFGGGGVTPVYQSPFGRRPTTRKVQRRNAS